MQLLLAGILYGYSNFFVELTAKLRFGIRTLAWDAQKGFQVNGKTSWTSVAMIYSVLCLVFVFCFIINGIFLSSAVYFTRDVLGNADLYSLVAIISILVAVVIMAFAPKMFAKHGKRRPSFCSLFRPSRALSALSECGSGTSTRKLPR